MKAAVIAFSFASLASAIAGATTNVRAVDPARSKAQFSVAHIWVEHVTGTVPIVRGSVTLAPDSPIPIAVSAVLDPGRINTGVSDRDHALESPDFFDAKEYPQWTFTSTKIVAQGANAFEMDGDLTIHGVTRPERLHVIVAGSSADPLYHATGQIDRHAFGMSTTRLDPVIGGVAEVTLEVALLP